MFEVLKAVATNMVLFLAVTPHSMVYIPHLVFSETLGPICRATGRHSGEKLPSV